MKQTAIEWLEYHISDLVAEYKLKTLFEQAKAMEREQIINAWNGGDYAYFYSKETGRDFEDGEQYYNETFKGGKQ